MRFATRQRRETIANDQTHALVAHIADAVNEVKREQTVMLAILSRMVETADAQTEMLGDILRAATQEAGPSEAALAIAALVSAVRENTEAVRAIAAQIAELPAEIGAEVARATPAELP